MTAKQTIDAAKIKRDAILSEYSKLIGEKNAFLLKMRTVLESELAITNHVIDTLPKVDEADNTPPPEVKPAEKSAPSEKTSAPEKTSTPEKISKLEEIPAEVEDDLPSNIISISTKPVTDETKTYTPVLAKEN